MPRDLQADQEMLRTVASLAERRDFAHAVAIAERVLSSGFEHPLLLNVVATRLELEGKLEEARQLLERAVRMAPDDVSARNALALCLQRLDRPGEALYHLDKLLQAHPELAFAHASRGNALIALGALAKARLSLLRALELDPENLAAEASLASIATHLGEHDEARVRARRVLGRVPGFPDSILSLAAAELAGGSIDSAQLLVCQLLAEGRAGPAERARANGLLGDVLDAGGRYVEAFSAYAACNEGLREHHNRFLQGTSMIPYLEAVIAATRREDPTGWATPPSADALPRGVSAHVFLLGFPCSGTDALGRALNGHPRVASLAEHELLSAGVLRYMREPVDFGSLLRADEGELRIFRESYWHGVREAGVMFDGKVFVDRHPLHSLKLPLIARLFPGAKILFAHRDPRDVLLSCFRRRFSLNPATYQLLTLEGGAAFYDATMRLADQSRLLLGLDWQAVRFEDLATGWDRELHRVCELLDLEWISGMTDVAVGLDAAHVGHWQHYRQVLEPILPILNPWVQRLGYAA
jgi:tetratricopeptide (TPR) repeat protein